jgi:hypothetical protein
MLKTFQTFQMLCPGIPEKAMKDFSVRKGGPTKINDNECLRG